MAAALSVTEPFSTGLGGDCFCLFYDHRLRTVRALNASGKSPKYDFEGGRVVSMDSWMAGFYVWTNFPRKMCKCALPVAVESVSFPQPVQECAKYALEKIGIHSVTVPGTAAGWSDTVHHFGSKQKSLRQLLQPAIHLAEEGFPVAPITAHHWQAEEQKLRSQSPDACHALLKQEDGGDGRAPRAGEVMRLPQMAQSLRILAEQGSQGFYSGAIGKAIVEFVQARGGCLTMKDMLKHTSTLEEPISLEVLPDLVLHECRPNGQGLVALIALGILRHHQEQFRNGSTADRMHLQIEALRLAFADAQQYLSDPSVSPVPVKELLDPVYLQQRASLIQLHHANPANIPHGSPIATSDTVYCCAVDKEGNACSFINSVYMGFGSGFIPPHCGFALQNRGANFSLIEGHPNQLQGGKRPYHTIIPAMVTNTQGELVMAYGVMGGFMQPQGHVQVLLNLFPERSSGAACTPQGALDAPRFCIAPQGVNKEEGTVFVEESMEDQVQEDLRKRGHRIQVLRGHARAMMGRGQVIQRWVDKDSGVAVLCAGSDVRGDGCAMGY